MLQTFFSKLNRQHRITILLVLLSTFFYISISYWTTRSNFYVLIGQYSFLFASYLYFIRQKMSVQTIIGLGIFFRAILLFSTPNLSDDFYRFLWDGELLQNGINPFLALPSSYMEDGSYLSLGLSKNLYEGMNSPNYYTIYPPILQLSFYLSAFLGFGYEKLSIFILKFLIFCAELGSFFFLYKLLNKWKKELSFAAIYILNPLVIIELVGNIHFEAYMICFLLGSVYFLVERKFFHSSLFMSFAICSKLLPLMFLPFIYSFIGFRKSILYYIITISTSALLFYPILDLDSILHLKESIDLYFQKFEFNASFYYLIREIGFWYKGYNIIGTAGKALSLVPFLCIVIIALTKKIRVENLPFFMLLGLTIYFLTATIIHPWYVTTLITLGLFYRLNFPIYWSFGIILSYWAYSNASYSENFYLLFLEYSLLFWGIWKDRFELKTIFSL